MTAMENCLSPQFTQVHQHLVSPSTAFEKMRKGFARNEAEKVLMREDIERRQAARDLDKVARGSKKRTRFPQGHIFNQEYQDAHPDELAERKATEEENRRVKRNVAARERRRLHALAQSLEAGPSGTVHEE